jgi:hypothetical protein
MVRPERFELPASWFVARRSIQLSYGRKEDKVTSRQPHRGCATRRLNAAPAAPNSFAQPNRRTLGGVRGANTTTSKADHHSVAQRRGCPRISSRQVLIVNKFNMLCRHQTLRDGPWFVGCHQRAVLCGCTMSHNLTLTPASDYYVGSHRRMSSAATITRWLLTAETFGFHTRREMGRGEGGIDSGLRPLPFGRRVRVVQNRLRRFCRTPLFHISGSNPRFVAVTAN